MSKKKKPSYSLISNIVFLFRIQYKSSKLSIFLLVTLIFVSTSQALLNIVLPRQVVYEVMQESTISRLVFTVSIFGIALIISSILYQVLTIYGSLLLKRVSIVLTDMKTKKTLETDYQNLESPDFLNMIQRADEALWGSSEGNKIERMIKDSYGFVTDIIGYLLFGTLLYFASPIIAIGLTILPLANYFLIRRVQKYQYENLDTTSSLDRKLWYIALNSGNIESAKDVRIYGLNKLLINMFETIKKERMKWGKIIALKTFRANIIEFIIILIRDGFAYVFLIYLVLNGEISIPDFVLYFSAVSAFVSRVGGIVNKLNELNVSSFSICDYRDLLNYPENSTRNNGATPNLNYANNICIKNLSFAYSSDTEMTIKNISFNIEAGKKIAIVGLNGAGKTTLVKCICGLYRPTEGEIIVDGKSVNEYSINDYFSLFSTVFQDFHLLPISIAENVSCTNINQTNTEKVSECLELVGLSDAISKLSDGIYSNINRQIHPAGIELSGGEQQKLLLARALYKNSPILVLDEPTYALDPISENAIYMKYAELLEGKTSIFISHRLSATKFCDEIILLDNGEIIERGSHEELICAKGRYAELFEIQSQYYRDEEK